MAIDKVTLEVLNNFANAIAESMAFTLMRTAYTTFVKETMDFATAVVTPEGEVFAYPQAYSAGWMAGLNLGQVSKLIKSYEEGDIAATNDPYSEFYATHTPDLHLWKPVFYKGQMVCYVTCHVHHTDMGGAVPASLTRTNTDIFQEGIRIPPQKLYKAGVLNEDLVNIIKTNVRIPEQTWGDIKAQVAALNTGELKIHEMIERFGIEIFREGMYSLLDYSEKLIRTIISEIPDGDYFFADYLDEDVVSDMPVRIVANMKVRGDEIVFDFTGSDPQVNCSMNIPTGGLGKHSIPPSALWYYFMTVNPKIPMNGAIMRAVSSILPKGTIMNPEFPAAVGMRSATVLRVQDVTLGCLMKAMPQKLPACPAGIAVIVAISTQDSKSGKRFVAVLDPIIGGAGGSPFRDGSNATGGFMSFLCNTPAEINETEVPVKILRYELIQDSGGAGKYRGGLGNRLDFQVLQPNTTVSTRNRDRNKFRPWGVKGGKAGSLSRLLLNPDTPKERDLGNLDIVRLEPGDVLSMRSPGGGGYGSPLERDPQSVLVDVQSGYISLLAAKEEYGVVIHNNQIDLEATQRLRSKLEITKNRAEFDYGPEREQYESIWSESTYHVLNSLLMRVPISLRPFVKKEIYQEVKSKTEEGPINELILNSWEYIKNKFNLAF
jgi:N-methylhydantoinase B